MTESNVVNFQGLQSLYSSDPKVRALFDVYAKRLRGRQESTAPRTKRVLKDLGIEMTSQELSEFYRKMQGLGIGRCVFGRHGKINRFIWGFHLRSVAEIAQGKQVSLASAPKTKVKLPRLKAAMPAPARLFTKKEPKGEPISVRKITVRKAGLEIEFPLSMSLEDWREAAVFLNNLSKSL